MNFDFKPTPDTRVQLEEIVNEPPPSSTLSVMELAPVDQIIPTEIPSSRVVLTFSDDFFDKGRKAGKTKSCKMPTEVKTSPTCSAKRN